MDDKLNKDKDKDKDKDKFKNKINVEKKYGINIYVFM